MLLLPRFPHDCLSLINDFFAKNITTDSTNMAPSFKVLAGCSAIVFVAAVGSYHSSSELQKRRLTLGSFFITKDPKSIAKKQLEEGMEWRNFLAMDNHEHVANLRILTMGSSRTYGATLKDRSTSAYPVLLSRNVTNLAIRATGYVSHL